MSVEGPERFTRRLPVRQRPHRRVGTAVSRRMVPTNLSAKPFCQARGAIRSCSSPMLTSRLSNTAPKIREVFLRTYRIVYRVRDDSILVLTVFEGHRLFPPGAAEAYDE